MLVRIRDTHKHGIQIVMDHPGEVLGLITVHRLVRPAAWLVDYKETITFHDVEFPFLSALTHSIISASIASHSSSLFA